MVSAQELETAVTRSALVQAGDRLADVAMKLLASGQLEASNAVLEEAKSCLIESKKMGEATQC